MLAIQLRGKRAGLIPVDCVSNSDRFAATLAPDAPGQLVDFFDGWRLAIRRYGGPRVRRWLHRSLSNFHMLDMRAEVANLIQRVPRRNLDEDFILDIRNGHRYVKQMLLR